MFTHSKHDILIIYYSINTENFLNQFPNFLHLICVTLNNQIYILEMIIFLLRMEKVKIELFERIRFVDKHSGGLDNSNIRIELL